MRYFTSKTIIGFSTVDIIPCRILKTEYCVVKESKVNCIQWFGMKSSNPILRVRVWKSKESSKGLEFDRSCSRILKNAFYLIGSNRYYRVCKQRHFGNEIA